jgi:hypothetical protein
MTPARWLADCQHLLCARHAQDPAQSWRHLQALSENCHDEVCAYFFRNAHLQRPILRLQEAIDRVAAEIFAALSYEQRVYVNRLSMLHNLTQLQSLNRMHVQLLLDEWVEELPEPGRTTVWQEVTSFLNNPLSTTLVLTNCGLRTPPPFFGYEPFTTRLVTLFCNLNQLAFLPEALGQCAKLTTLFASGCPIVDVPDALLDSLPPSCRLTLSLEPLSESARERLHNKISQAAYNGPTLRLVASEEPMYAVSKIPSTP